MASAPVRSAAVQRRIDAYNLEIPRLVGERARAGLAVRYVDIAGLLTIADLADELHPNDQGYAKMAAGWFTALVG